MLLAEPRTYEEIYFTLWETAGRYSDFTEFRVIGSSHDGRMIPMLVIGRGQTCVFCVAGFRGSDRRMPACLASMAEEYCRGYECGWMMEEFYDMRSLLRDVRICVIPLVNPDGYEICREGYRAVRNATLRQVLRMREIPPEEFAGNGRGVQLEENFPTAYYNRRRINDEPASENETKALMRIFREYESRGLLSFGLSQSRGICYGKPHSFIYNRKSCRFARHLRRFTESHAEKRFCERGQIRQAASAGAPELFYGETTGQPAFRIRMEEEAGDAGLEKTYGNIHTLPLEYLFLLDG